MKQLIDLDNLKIYMRSEGLLTDNDMSRLQVLPPHNTPDRVIHTLASIVQQKGQAGLTRFMAALRRSADEEQQSGHDELHQILKKDACRVQPHGEGYHGSSERRTSLHVSSPAPVAPVQLATDQQRQSSHTMVWSYMYNIIYSSTHYTVIHLLAGARNRVI